MQKLTVWGLSSAVFALGLWTASAQPTQANPTAVQHVAQASPSPAEAARRKGDKLIEDARKESGDKQKEAKTQALTEYKASAEAYEKMGDRVKAPLMMATVAQLSWELEDYAQSLTFYQRLAAYVDADRNVFWQVAARHGIAANYQQLEDFDRALVAYHEALDLVRKNPQLSQLPAIGGNVGLSFKHSTKLGMTWQSQIDVLSSHNALESGNQMRWRLLRLVTLGNLATLYRTLGDSQQYVDLLTELEPILREPDAPSRQAYNGLDEQFQLIAVGLQHLLLSGLYHDLNRPEDAQKSALIAFDQVKKISEFLAKPQKDESTQALSQMLSGYVPLLSAMLMGFIQDQSESKSASNEANQAIVAVMDQYLPQLLKQGVIAPETQKQLAPYIKQLEPFYLHFKAEQLSKAGQTDRAIATHQQALTGFQQPLQLGDLKQYLDAKTSQVFQQAVQDFQTDYHGKTHRALGEIYAKRGQHDQAIAKYQQAIQVLDRKPANSNAFFTKGAKEKRATYFLMGQAYAASKQIDRAFQTFQTVLNLQTKEPDIIEQANTYWELASLEQQRGNLDQAQKQIETAIERLESQPPTKTPAKSNDTKAQPIAKSRYKSYLDLVDYLDSKRNYYDFYVGLLMQRHGQNPRAGYDVLAFQAVERSRSRSLRTLRYSDPKVAIAEAEKQALKATLNTSLKDLQARIPEDAMLLSYHLGDRQSYLWQITRNGFQTYPLPPRAQIEKTARQFRDQIQAKDYAATRGVKIALAQPKPNQPQANQPKANPAASLSEMLLQPIAASLKTQKIMVTADGALQYLPFAALPKPNAASPLLIDHEVVSLPSAFMLGFNQTKPNTAAKTLAIFADPVYNNLDDRVKTAQPKSPITFYDRLYGTRDEANAITALIPTNQQWRNYDFAASYRNATNNELRQYRIIHFATHGQFDSDKPQRSGMVFSSLDATGLPQRGLFSTVDAFNLDLTADLVVLSGCTTALGKEIRGEGLIGLTGGFLYAGSKQVVASLWDVDDAATASLMTQFYQRMLTQGLSPAAALRQAQIQLWNSGQWQQPYYWSAFVIHGA